MLLGGEEDSQGLMVKGSSGRLQLKITTRSLDESGPGTCTDTPVWYTWFGLICNLAVTSRVRLLKRCWANLNFRYDPSIPVHASSALWWDAPRFA